MVRVSIVALLVLTAAPAPARGQGSCGLIYMRNRWYDSCTGRFLQPDPLPDIARMNASRAPAFPDGAAMPKHSNDLLQHILPPEVIELRNGPPRPMPSHLIGVQARADAARADLITHGGQSRYSYASNNPVNNKDPDGLITVPGLGDLNTFGELLEGPVWDWVGNHAYYLQSLAISNLPGNCNPQCPGALSYSVYVWRQFHAAVASMKARSGQTLFAPRVAAFTIAEALAVEAAMARVLWACTYETAQKWVAFGGGAAALAAAATVIR